MENAENISYKAGKNDEMQNCLSLYNHAKNSLDFQYSAGPSGPSAQIYSGLYFVTMSYNCGNATCCIIKDKKYPQLIMCKWEFGMSEGGVLSPFGINP